MVSTFSGFYISLRSMQAQQMALETAAHNVANAETEGYTRQRADLAATTPWPVPSLNSSGIVGQIGTGVEVSKIERLRDQYLDIQLREEITTLGEWTIKQDTLEQVEVVFQEPTDTGLESLITQFWDGWEDLSMNPEGTSSAVRTTLVETATSLADALRYTSQQLEEISEDMDSMIEINVDSINSIANQINALNKQIKTAKTAGFEPNDLMDQRDLLLDQLSEVIDFEVTDNGDGTINVNLYNDGTGGYDSRLVDGEEGHVNTLETAEESGELIIQWATYTSVEPTGNLPVGGTTNLTVNGGELKGLFDTRDNMLSEYRTQLDNFASNLITEINNLHMGGYDLNGDAGIEFFTGTDASDIQVNSSIEDDVMLVAAASDPAQIPGDGSNALAISNLSSADGVCEGTSFNDYYRNLISTLGVDTDEAQRMVTNQQALVDQLETRKESISGVAIDEELAHMLEFQHVYEASARFLTTLDGMLDTLINRMAW